MTPNAPRRLAMRILNPIFACILPILTTGTLAFHDRRDSPPARYTNLGSAPSDHVLTLRLALLQNNITGLEQRLLQVSSPSHPDYGKWLSKAEVEAHVKPEQTTIDAVQQFLALNNLTASKATSAGDVLSLEIFAGQASSLFAADFSTFQSVTSGVTVVRTLSYSMPTSLQGHVKYVHPTTVFPDTPRKKTTPSIAFPPTSTRETGRSVSVPASCDESVVTPDCLIDLYGIPTSSIPPTNVQIGITGLNNGYPQTLDLKLFLETYRPELVNNTWTFQSVFNGTIIQRPGNTNDGEPNLDTQMVISLANGIEALYLSVGPEPTTDAQLDLAQYLLSLDNPPSVLTSSYQNGNTDSSFPLAQAIDACNVYMQFGARGTSVIWASGDSGVGLFCIDDQFAILWPDSCPYITTVGATYQFGPEVAANLSSGGFANTFPRPAYQDDAVLPYLDFLGDTYTGLFNASGRGVPDVSAQGVNMATAFNDTLTTSFGTSFSSPIFATIIGHLNNELVSKGKSTLGFLNPWLYANPGAFNDVVSGSNPSCDTDGFPATTGWDPVTGLGTPNYPALRAAAGL
ncbi:peptidase S8/S53 domain-containing protein [Roridomyces roridus]|uniref:tripeptidyl-peptidase II n=1 Tax=Roridomyces roridus TaxID=1738132 RepID=A0AAD7BCD8_9AGAR|nr:peptidase S8/S53 domain-containing protein [Roridomyces roridus]